MVARDGPWELDVAWTNYHDDYPVVEFSFLADNTNHTTKALTSLLGFECSTDKELPFADEAEMLGVVLQIQCGSFECEKRDIPYGRVGCEFAIASGGKKS